MTGLLSLPLFPTSFYPLTLSVSEPEQSPLFSCRRSLHNVYTMSIDYLYIYLHLLILTIYEQCIYTISRKGGV